MQKFLPKTYYQTVDPASAAPPVVVPPAQAAADPAVNPPLGKDGLPFDPARAQSTIERLRAENTTLANEKRQRDAAESQATEEQQRKQGEFETLANDFKGKFETSSTELESTKAERDKAFEILNADIKTRIEKLPEAVRGFVPGEKTSSPLDRLAKIAELETMGAAFSPAAPGLTPVRKIGDSAQPNQQQAQQPKRLGIL